jgi:hypothetical protein
MAKSNVQSTPALLTTWTEVIVTQRPTGALKRTVVPARSVPDASVLKPILLK